ncbi:MAG TPA: phosphomannomutase/phosphoglucomutase [Patescibacteria group bacterium]|nr:phosphomannomutase/phosphoglucomutase [Patescibacteria group bacterium]
MDINPSIFKSYDVRGIYPTEFNEEVATAITKAYIKFFGVKKVILGRDVRESGDKLFEAVKNTFINNGIDVTDIGVVSTDLFYFAVGSSDVDGGITISASHNPREWNGMNFCKRNAEPISSETGLSQMKDLILKNSIDLPGATKKGTLSKKDFLEEFIKKSVSFIDISNIKPFKIVANANFGVDFIILKKAVEMYNLPLTLVPLNEKPDGTFPKGPPNPLLPQNREELLDLIKKEKADLGVSWDADGDRCFFADETGTFIEGYFMTAIIAKEMLKKYPGAKILIDPRLVWATTEEITNSGGVAIVSKPGMTIIADRMRQENGVFAGEMSSHFYFKENFNRDNGIIPLFIILEMLSNQNTTLSKLALPYTSKYFTPGEINFETEKKDEIIEAITQQYKEGKQEHIDGLSVEFSDWRFNLRKSNTENLLRLNIETREKEILDKRFEEIKNYIESFGAHIH